MTAKKLKHFAKQPADAWHSFTIGPAGLSSQQSCADVTTTSDVVTSCFGTAKAPAIGSIANDSATKNVNRVRLVGMRLLSLLRISVASADRSNDDFGSFPSLLAGRTLYRLI
jgi:hypothetical protein